ncbi:16S rRNA (guanine(966)-N(2))-methyltransferase RsmD [Aquipuribacter nitratireducens]|uniref:16S rRNA (Guanine(966)-N(2))-methyltransferase RsmD n=1 Tax=Aquipuribacter nitratireducens TaxID=650104 RepID=A0ABW0GKK5_9MICO
MRIVAGTARGRRLAAPRGSGTRPTSDRTREALFARLDAWGAVEGARVLDLFCGSGALALEALSRGAAEATGVEADRAAARLARDNAAGLGLPLVVVADRAERWLGGAQAEGPWDLVLLDPPYDLGEGALAAVLGAVAERCSPGAVVVVERSARSPEPTWPAGLTPLEPRTYGETTVWFAEPPDADRSAPPGDG